MQIREITTKEDWEGFLENCNTKTFLQSWNWGELNLASGCKVWRLGVYNSANIVGVCSVYKVTARRGIFFSIPHGPVLMNGLAPKDKREVLELLLLHLSDVAKAENVSFVRISPLLLDNEENKNIFVDLGFRQAPMHASAYEATWKLDLVAVTDLFSAMRKTTRYLIKKATENQDISVEKTSDPVAITVYQKLNREVAKRQHFTPFSDELIKNEFEIFNKDNQALFFFGKYKGEIAAGVLIIFWGGIAFYHQAASLSKYSKYSIPYLLQWEAIKEAEKRGCRMYDFWGYTDPEKYPKHPWAGPTLFKMGFGGYKAEYIKTQDFILSKKYWVNYIIEKIRKTKRGL